MKIPIKYVIESGAWFQCEYIDEVFTSDNLSFKLKVLSFDVIKPDILNAIRNLKLDEGILWLMRIEVINLNKEEISAADINDKVVLLDQDDYKFNAVYDNALNLSEFGESIGIKRFSGWSDVPKLRPRIKASGALPFLLPDEDVAEYFLSVERGNILEV